MSTRVPRLPGFIIIVGYLPVVNWLCVEAGLGACGETPAPKASA